MKHLKIFSFLSPSSFLLNVNEEGNKAYNGLKKACLGFRVNTSSVYHEVKCKRGIWSDFFFFSFHTGKLKKKNRKTAHLITHLNWISEEGDSSESPIQLITKPSKPVNRKSTVLLLHLILMEEWKNFFQFCCPLVAISVFNWLPAMGNLNRS